MVKAFEKKLAIGCIKKNDFINMFKPKITLAFWKKNLDILAEEFFYFLSFLLLTGAGLEIILPGFFILYFNIAILALLWLLTLLFLLLYVRR